jgi:hypothetical protein
MADDPERGERRWFSDKTKYAKLMDEIDAKAGIVHDPTATGEKVQQMMLDQGVRPEENILSRDIIRAKYADECEEDRKMDVVQKPRERRRFADKAKYVRLMEEIDAKAGVVVDPDATVEKLRRMLLEQGIRPEDNLLSRDIIRAKYPEAEEE